MDQNRYRLVREIVLGALERSGDERARYLTEACGEDAGLRAEVDSLLAQETRTPDIVEPGGIARHMADALGENAAPERVGPYHLREELGEGGMGVVYRAEQEEPIRREVALKLVKRGMDTRRVVARFASERRTLALMDHPNIARVLDAGETDGRPYFVMEYVRGPSLIDYCDAKRLGVTERIELFLSICRAVQHAHQKGIIHRDLKPSNVLVTEADGVAVPKVIDFGIAKALEDDGPGRSLMTLEGQVVGTPEYMSPEQAGLAPDAVDTRTDVYSLGVLLYELLTGDLPFGRDAVRGASLGEYQRMLREQDPPRPSTRVTGVGAVAEARGTDPRALRRRLRSELDWILLQAVERDPARRYPSASELAADLERYLHGLPVEAGAPGATYRVRKFVGRHRVGVVAAALVLVALLAGAAGTAWQAVRATREAERASERLEDVTRFANSVLFDLHDKIATLPNSTPAREFIVTTALGHLDEIAADPEAADRLLPSLSTAYWRLGEVQRDLGSTEDALEAFTRSLELAERAVALHPEDPDLRAAYARRCNDYAIAQGQAGDIEAAYQWHHKAKDPTMDLVAEYPESTAYVWNLVQIRSRLAYTATRTGRPEEAVAEAQAALDLALAHADDPEAPLHIVRSHAFLAESLAELNRDEESLDHYRLAVERMRRIWQEDPDDARSLQNMGILTGAVGSQEVELGRFEEALASLHESLGYRERRAELQPGNHRALHDVTRVYEQIGTVYADWGRPAEALEQFETGLALCDSLERVDPGNRFLAEDIVLFHVRLSDTLTDLGRPREALEHVAEANRRNDPLLADEPEKSNHHENRVWSREYAGDAYAALARAARGDERRRLWEEALASYEAGVEHFASMEESGLITPLTRRSLGGVFTGKAAADSALAALDRTP